MKYGSFKFVVALLLVGCLDGSRVLRAAETKSHYDEPYRPQYHFTPTRNWMNDPNGPIYYAGQYHLFFQYNPYGEKWGHMSWGHAVSPDIVHWRELPVALEEENGVMIFSGSTVFDGQNTSGLCKGSQASERSCLIAIYTGATEKSQTQNIAYSDSEGRTWAKFSGNPVLDLHLQDFRDPKVFWHKASRKWIMAVSLAAQHKIRFYSSQDLKHWTALSDFGPAGATDGVWECPDLFDLPIEGEPGQTRWVLSVNLNPGSIAGGSGNQYFVGRFDGSKFVMENAGQQPLWADYGKDFYASTSFAEMRPGDHRRVWIAWLDNWEYADKLPTHPWRGAMTIPRVLTLRRFADGLRLVQKPADELRSLREQHVAIESPSIDAANVKLKQAGGDSFEILAEIDAGSASEIGLRVLKDRRRETLIGADLIRSEVFVDRTESGGDSIPSSFGGRHKGPLRLAEQKKVLLHVFVDRSSVEVFANRGETVITDQVFPNRGSQDVELYSIGGKTGPVKLDVWRLSSARR